MKRRNFLQALLAGAASITLWPSRSYSVPPQLREAPKIKPETLARLRKTPGWYSQPIRHVRFNPDTHFLEVSYEREPALNDWVSTEVEYAECE